MEVNDFSDIFCMRYPLHISILMTAHEICTLPLLNASKIALFQIKLWLR